MGRSVSDVVGAPPPMVREEAPGDSEAVSRLLTRAFRGEAEREAVERLRAGEGGQGLLAVRSERRPGADMADVGAGEAVGYLRLTPARVGEDPVLVMAPLAVAPASRHLGVGTYLVQFAVEMVADQGYAAVVTPYDEDFLDRFGFQPADRSVVTDDGMPHLRIAQLSERHVAGPVRVPDALAPLMGRA